MKYSITFLTLFIGFTLFSQPPREVVQAQLDAYNARDTDAFMAVFAEDAALYRYGRPDPVAEGTNELREVYTRLFEKSPDLHSEVINRTIIGNKVIDYELITGRGGHTVPLKLVMIYEVEDGKIIKGTSLRE